MTEVVNITDGMKKYYQMMIDDMRIDFAPGGNTGSYNINITTKYIKKDSDEEAEKAKLCINQPDEFNELLRKNIPEFIDKIHIKLNSPDDNENAPAAHYTMTLQVSADEDDIDSLMMLCKLIEDAYAQWLSDMNC